MTVSQRRQSQRDATQELYKRLKTRRSSKRLAYTYLYLVKNIDPESSETKSCM